jgi:nitroreductase
MNDTLKTISKRYSCRGFSDKPIDGADLQTIADAGVQAPSAMNRQGWQLILIKNKTLIAELEAEGLRVLREMPDKSSYERVMSRGGKLFYDAQAIAIIAIKPPAAIKGYELIDLGIVAQNVSLAAASLGVGNCHCGMISLCFAGEKAAELKKKLKFFDGYECGLAVLLGYAKEQGTPHAPDAGKITIIE